MVHRSALISAVFCCSSALSCAGTPEPERSASSSGMSAVQVTGVEAASVPNSPVAAPSTAGVMSGVMSGSAGARSKPDPMTSTAGMTPSAAGAAGMMPSAAGVAGMTQPLAGTGGSAGAAAAAGTGGTAGATPAPCTTGAVAASEVLFIGESFIAQTGDIPRMTSELARKAGTIGADESYRSFAVSGTQLTTGDIPNQYTRARMAAPVKVVLMDGGGNDLLFGADRCMGSFDAGCKEVVAVVADMFADFKSGGVTDVVYFFYPDPMGIGARIKDAMDILRPEMKSLCDGASDIRCVWVDQRESWDGNYDEFTSDGIHPTAAGSMASAQQIWAAMVAHCIAQ
jgi:lysophospholipase L1-like esterase